MRTGSRCRVGQVSEAVRTMYDCSCSCVISQFGQLVDHINNMYIIAGFIGAPFGAYIEFPYGDPNADKDNCRWCDQEEVIKRIVTNRIIMLFCNSDVYNIYKYETLM